MKANILFKSNSGNKYIYNRKSKYIFLCHPIQYYLVELLNKGFNIVEWFNNQNDEIKFSDGNTYHRENVKYYLDKIEYLKLNHQFVTNIENDDYFQLEISSEKIKSILANIENIGFEVTYACNLECRYCIYGEMYDENEFDERKNKFLSFQKVEQILNFVIEHSESEYNTNHNKVLLVNFYGGEPLLNFELINQTVQFLRTKQLQKTRFRFGMTTNCVLINKHIDFLVENDFTLLCSIDGNEINNGYRIFKNGEKAYPFIYNNLKKLKDSYPDYYNKRVFFNSVLHNLNSIKDIHNFFEKEFDKMPAIAEISSYGIKEERKEDYYERYRNINESFNESEGCQEIKRDLKNLSIGYAQTSVFLIANSPFVYKDYNQLVYKRKIKFYPTATCLPFTKRIFMNVNGRVLPCENVDHEKSTLGQVTDNNINIDEENITEIYNSAYKQIVETCKTCYRIDNCNYCFFAKGNESRENISKCSGRYSYNDFAKFLSSRISNIENEPELYSSILKEEVLK